MLLLKSIHFLRTYCNKTNKTLKAFIKNMIFLLYKPHSETKFNFHKQAKGNAHLLCQPLGSHSLYIKSTLCLQELQRAVITI